MILSTWLHQVCQMWIWKPSVPYQTLPFWQSANRCKAGICLPVRVLLCCSGCCSGQWNKNMSNAKYAVPAWRSQLWEWEVLCGYGHLGTPNRRVSYFGKLESIGEFQEWIEKTFLRTRKLKPWGQKLHFNGSEGALWSTLTATLLSSLEMIMVRERNFGKCIHYNHFLHTSYARFDISQFQKKKIPASVPLQTVLTIDPESHWPIDCNDQVKELSF